ncbi:hypothetical protein [Streptomyces erythrochromogenes]|uniref:hypothetical protein n=1 Tax=Streptomyces erythrochromogenes TaxID=285574 RepID=UPI003697F456
MADNMAARLMAMMQSGSKAPESRERPSDPRSVEIMNQMRGGTERDTHAAETSKHNRDYQAEREFQDRIDQRARELTDRGVGGRFPKETAKNQLRAEAAQRQEQTGRREVYDRMVASNRAEAEAHTTESLTRDLQQSVTHRRKRREERIHRLVDTLIAEMKAAPQTDTV